MSKDKPHITKLKWCDMWHCEGKGLSPMAIGVSPVDAYSKWLLLKMEGELALASRHWLLRDPHPFLPRFIITAGRWLGRKSEHDR